MRMSIETIVNLLNAKRIGNREAEIDWILTDSRSLCFPEETLFFALKTKRNDGHKYISDLYERGVRNFVVSELPEEMDRYEDTNFLQVPHPLKALQRLVEKYRLQFDVPVIGVTGSNGKTVVKEWLYQLLSPERIITRSPRSYNSQIGVPLSVWLMNDKTELGIFEAGISEMGEMEALQSIIRPTVGILTNIGGAHQENFYSTSEKCMEKLQLFKDCDVVVYDADDELISSCVAKLLYGAREIAWSKKDNERPLYIESVKKEAYSTTIRYRYLGMPYEYIIPFIDDASVENSLHCLAVALYMMLPAEKITERMAKLEPIAMRLEVKEGKNGCVLINDSYNSDLASLDIALDFMSRRSEDKGRKRTLILSDMFEAHVAAIYLDAGFENARDYVVAVYGGKIDEVVKKGNVVDYKTQLQEKLQEKGPCEILYKQLSAEGPVHHCLFEMQVVADGKVLGTGQAYSKKEAQQLAAKEALEKLN